MALQLEYTMKSTGVTGNYWKITAYEAVSADKHRITLSLFVDKNASDNDKVPIGYAYVTVPEPTDESHFQRDYIYQAVKSLNINVEGVNIYQFFQSALDV